MEVFIDEFCGQKVLTIIYDGRVCWLAIQMATILQYEEPSKAISYCIKNEEFDKGIDYDILSGTKLKEFKNAFKNYDDEILKFVPKVIIFYEDGLFGFLQFSHKPLGSKLRKWIRKEVKPRLLKEYGLLETTSTSYIDEKINTKLNIVDAKDLELDKLNKTIENNDFDVDKFQRLRMANESAKLLKGLLDDVDTDSVCKLAVIKTLFSEAGINLPIYFNKKN
ncbi:MAG: BRO-N domain-containing protein [Sarcina sp.]